MFRQDRSPLELRRCGAAVLGAVLMLFPATQAWAQECSVRGTLRDGNGPVANARITAQGKETRTGNDGSFRFDGLPAGSVSFSIDAAGVSDARSLFLNAGDDLEVEWTLDDSITRLQSIGQIGADTTGVRASIDKRFESAIPEEVVGEAEFNRTTGSDVGDKIKQLPAVTIVGGRFAFVRGLGDRYSQTLVNGSSLPSPEPDKRTIPLDLFPSAVVRQVSIAKTYSPELPGEFAGGSVRILTRNVPEESFFKMAFSTKYRRQTSGREFESYAGGTRDAFGFDDGTRDLPDAVTANRVIGGGGGLSDSQLQTIGRSFRNVWSSDTRTAPVDSKVSLSFGDSYEWGVGKVGVVGAASLSNSYETIENSTFRNLTAAGTTAVVVQDREIDTYTFESQLSALLNFSYEPMQNHRLSFRNFAIKSASDRVTENRGFDAQLGGQVRVTQLRWVERGLYNGQLSGEHLLIGDTFLDWRFSYSKTQRDEPDNRQVRYEQVGSGEFEFQNSSASGRRNFFTLDEDVMDLGVDISFPFSPFGIPDPDIEAYMRQSEEGPDELQEGEIPTVAPAFDLNVVIDPRPQQRIQLGAAYVGRDRDFESRRFRYIPQASPVDDSGNPIDLFALPEEILSLPNINPNGVQILETTRPTDSYAAEQLMLAAYALADFRVVRSFRFQGGVRVERSDQDVTTFDLFSSNEVRAEVDETDVLPAINMTWDVAPKQHLRLSASQTVSRPEFRELAQFQFRDVDGGFGAQGNPDLERATLQSYDLRWEWLPGPGELVSASVFLKQFDEPIERVVIPTGSDPITTWENAKSAELYGVEFEVRKRLGFVAGLLSNASPTDPDRRDLEDFLNKFSLNLNFAYIDSEVKINDNSSFAQTNDSRPLQGQPEYTINLGLYFDSPQTGWAWSLVANSFGENLTAVGAFGVDDEVQLPRINLDAVISKSFGASKLSLSAENLLDDPYEFEQSNITTRRYKRGWAIGVSYSYDF